MNDKDFDNIGKRLYDMEADPPKNGWKRIATGITLVPPAGKQVFIRKHWWKPLVILVPLSLYLLIHEPIEKTADGSKKSAETNTKNGIETHKDSTLMDSSSENNLSLNRNSPEKNPKTDEIISKENNSPRRPKTLTLKSKDSNPGDEGQPTRRRAKKLSNSRGSAATPGIESKSTIDTDEYTTELKSGVEISKRSKAQSNVNTRVADTSVNNQDNALTQAQLEIKNKDAVAAGVAGFAEQNSGVNTHNNSIPSEVQGEGDSKREDEQSTNGLSEQPSNALEDNVDQEEELTKQKTQNSEIDSAQAKEDDKNKAKSTWRMNFAFTPQYMTKKVNPEPNDEVLMINLKDNNAFYHEQIGFGLSLGAGKAITENWYMDAFVNYLTAKQSINYSYSNGTVDTLVAHLQNDGSIVINPVYDLHQSEIVTRFSYGGARIAATYYFWNSPRRRFSLSGGAGVHYLLNSDTRENLDGNWSTIASNPENKLNYTLMISAGYNVRLGNWDLQIAPVLNYFLYQDKNPQLPFNINQRSYGLNLMLSRNFLR